MKKRSRISKFLSKDADGRHTTEPDNLRQESQREGQERRYLIYRSSVISLQSHQIKVVNLNSRKNPNREFCTCVLDVNFFPTRYKQSVCKNVSTAYSLYAQIVTIQEND